MKIFILIVLCISIGIAIGHPIGKHEGFESGAEWAMFQASIIAKEEGIDIPVTYSEKCFKLTIKRKTGSFKRSQILASSNKM